MANRIYKIKAQKKLLTFLESTENATEAECTTFFNTLKDKQLIYIERLLGLYDKFKNLKSKKSVDVRDLKLEGNDGSR